MIQTWVVLDIETTGLDARSDLILELAAMHIGSKDLEVQHVQSWLCHHPYAEIEAKLNPFTRKMHEENGLLAELKGFATPPDWTSADAYRLLDDQLLKFFEGTGAPKRGIMLAGNSVDFDRGFVLANLPRSAEYLHHRVIDASGLREVYRAWVKEPPETPKVHRALEDCQMSLNTLRWMARDVFMNPSVPR
jgi:oligoribonuclease (3'-5' exoribonuclease)